MEKKMKKLELGLDAKKSFAQMYEDWKMNETIGGQVMELDPVIGQEHRKEIRTREPQSPFKIRSKSNNLARIFLWTILIKGRVPLDFGFRWQKTRSNEGFQVWVWALTWCPSHVAGRFRLHTLPLARLLGCHMEIHWSLHANALANPNPRTEH